MNDNLITEVRSLQATVATAAKLTFLPAPAREAIVQAGKVITLLAREVLALRAAIALSGDTMNDQLGLMRRRLDGYAPTQAADLELAL